MARKGLNQGQLGQLAGVSQPTVSAALRGKPVSAKSAVAIKLALDGLPNVLDSLMEQSA